MKRVWPLIAALVFLPPAYRLRQQRKFLPSSMKGMKKLKAIKQKFKK
ncbi:hypothetical protein [Archaeoglobus sp.]|nr:hypothetical protein [Archaeoglobus sp.]